MRRSATLAALVLTAAACGAADSAPHAITATSDTYIVVGQYWRIDMDRVVALIRLRWHLGPRQAE